VQLSRQRLAELLELNRLRALDESPRRAQLEALFASRYAADRKLAVYGSLAPGESNHHQLSQLDGTWLPGHAVRGERMSRGWGAALGFPAVRWSLDGPFVAAKLFVSDQLPEHWSRLDAFEGPEYLRLVVPVYAGERISALANLYAANDDREER